MSYFNVHVIFYLYLMRFCLVYGQWNNGLYFSNKSSPNTLSLPVQYVPAPTPINQGSPAYCRQNDPFTNVPFWYDPYYQNYPGEGEVRSLQSSYPGQPVIVINNGDFDRRDREFKIEELLTHMFALKGHDRRHYKPEYEIPREKPDVPRNPPSYSYHGYSGSGISRDVPENMKPRESPKPNKINITIVLPSTSSSTNIQVENKTKEEKKNIGEFDKVDEN